MKPCPAESELEAFVVEPKGLAAVGKHVDRCATCRALVEDIRENQKFMARVGGALAAANNAVGPGTKTRFTHPLPPAGTVPGFELTAEIGRGGQGVVYRAVQLATKRPAAVKMLLSGAFASGQQRRRFEREIEIAARLRHPCIVSVFDSGLTADGRRFVAMEFVPGIALDTFVRANLPLKRGGARARANQIMTLAREVAEGVGYAHANGVIHRDLKPSNILVDSHGRPRVLDFGLARADDDGPSASITREFAGTPAYAAPEQFVANLGLVGTRTDVYALGLILYSALTEKHPYPCDGPLAEVSAHTVSTEPTPLSKYVPKVPSDVETIVLKALSKDPARRYSSASALAADIDDYLAGRPISARRDSTLYVLKRLAAKHRVPAIAAALVVLTIAAAAIGLALLAKRVSDQKTRAEFAETAAAARARELELVSAFQAKMLSQVDATEAGRLLAEDVADRFSAALAKAGMGDAERTALIESFSEQWSRVNATDAARTFIDRTILTPSVDAITAQFKDQPTVEATLCQVLADRYDTLGLYDAAMPLQQRALDLRRRVLGNEHADTLMALNNTGGLLQTRGQLTEAEPLLFEALETRRRVFGDDHPDTLVSISNLGSLREVQGRLDEAEGLYREAVERARRVLGEEHVETVRCIANLGVLLETKGDLDGAEPCYRAALNTYRAVLGLDHPYTQTAMHNMGQLLQAKGEFAEAERVYREALEASRRVLGADHPDTAITVGDLGVAIQAQWRLAEAEPYLLEAMETCRRTLGDEHDETLARMHNVAVHLWLRGRFAEAESIERQALDCSRRVLGDDHPDTLSCQAQLGVILQSRGDLLGAAPLIEDAAEKYRSTLGTDHPDTLRALAKLGTLRFAQYQSVAAAEILSDAEQGSREAFRAGHAHHLAFLLMHLGRARTNLGRYADAENNLIEAHTIYHRIWGPTHPDTIACVAAIVHLYETWSRADPHGEHDRLVLEWKGKQ